MKACYITKNKFFINQNYLISNREIDYKEKNFFGFEWYELEKLVFIGFREKFEFDGYKYDLSDSNVYIIGPQFQEENKYLIDRLKNIYRTMKEIWKKREILKDCNLVFSCFFEYTLFEFIILKLICKKSKFLLYIIGDYPTWNYQKRKNILLKYFLEISQYILQLLSDEVWFISEYLRNKYLVKSQKNKSLVIRFSTFKESEIGKAKSLNIQQIKLLFSGRFEKEKQPQIPLLILKNLRKKGYNAFLTYVGGGRLINEIKEKIKIYNLKNFVEIINWIQNRKKLMDIYAKNDFLVFPSIPGEGLGLTIIEAMSQGLVPIVTDCGGPSEIIENAKNGFILPFYETDEKQAICFSEKIEEIIKNPILYKTISENNIEKAKEWTIEKFLKIQREAILKVLNL